MDSCSCAQEEDLTIREMRPDDASEVSVLSGQLGYDRSPEEIRAWIGSLACDGHRGAAFVACVGQEIVGWIEISIERRLQTPPFAFIGGLVVKEGKRGRGIGRRLCEWAEAWSWEQGVDTLQLTSQSTRVDAHRFYLRDGYRVIKSSQVFEKTRPR
jgi:GNAT superfamily N-acetyltransferase